MKKEDDTRIFCDICGVGIAVHVYRKGWYRKAIVNGKHEYPDPIFDGHREKLVLEEKYACFEHTEALLKQLQEESAKK